jgi:hypothetical protein
MMEERKKWRGDKRRRGNKLNQIPPASGEQPHGAVSGVGDPKERQAFLRVRHDENGNRDSVPLQVWVRKDCSPLAKVVSPFLHRVMLQRCFAGNTISRFDKNPSAVIWP